MDSPERRNNTGSSRIPSRLAHRARPIRQYRTDATLSRLLPPFPATPGSGCLQLHPVATTTRRWAVSHLHPTTAAPRGALPHVRDTTGVGAPFTPRTTVLPRFSALLNRRLPLPNGQSLHPAGTSHRRGSR